ncbi:MAG: alpha-amylase family glycosyl hydrolase [Saprospiraceae bacterium]
MQFQGQERTWCERRDTVSNISAESFEDTDGDGFGDFKGVIEQLDYIERLGVDIVWMNPFFASPMIDNGYDAADYRAIHPRYGTMEDFKAMLDGFHERGIKFVLDVVVNHSSNQHEWFLEASHLATANTTITTTGGLLKKATLHATAFSTPKVAGITWKR